MGARRKNRSRFFDGEKCKARLLRRNNQCLGMLTATLQRRRKS